MNRTERRRREREREKAKWIRKMKKRGGFKRKKAKRWGDDCDYKECRQWEDGTCQYPKRDAGRCFLEEE